MEEVWKQVRREPYGVNYSVSDRGRVKNSKTGRILKPTITRNGYERVIVCGKGVKPLTGRVHRLVAEAFFGESELFVNHINGIKTDNRLENLEYVTRSENALHAYRLGMKCRAGIKTPQTRLTKEQVCDIKKMVGEKSDRELAALYGVNRVTISYIRRGITWKDKP